MAETAIGNLGVAICYDWLFPEALRQLTANGAEVLIRVSAYMDPWGATAPMDWWTVVNRCRALENIAYVVASNQAASLSHYPPFSWPGGSMVVDFDGRDPRAGRSRARARRSWSAPVDIAALRHERAVRRGHQNLGHLRTECYPLYRQSLYPPGRGEDRGEAQRGRQRRGDRGGEGEAGVLIPSPALTSRPPASSRAAS